MKKPILLNIIISLSIISLVILLDCLSKRWVINNLSLFEEKIITSMLNIVHIQNYGLAFGIFSEINQENKYFSYLINIITIVIILKIICYILKNPNYYNIPYTLIISGAIGNLIDRLYFGFVIDFIDVHFKNWHFAVFNIADISIFFGSILIIYIHTFMKEI
ncbi:MAG: signal peptidase II [Buchnera aphidicola (Floraphis choui)]